MTYHIWKEFHFSASHQLTHLPDEHPCARLHGHNYVVEIELSADDTDPTGFVLDYRALDPFKAWVDRALDHRHLNDVMGNAVGTTAESLAHQCYLTARTLLGNSGHLVSAARVRETPKTCAEYRP